MEVLTSLDNATLSEIKLQVKFLNYLEQIKQQVVKLWIMGGYSAKEVPMLYGKYGAIYIA